uniref:RRM domain-containing protein n=1 Tax=Amazona collaria TaxID=241587 RepID=A0A8B9F9J6_9PSIT
MGTLRGYGGYGVRGCAAPGAGGHQGAGAGDGGGGREAEGAAERGGETDEHEPPPPGNAGPVIMSLEEKMEADARSIYVGNVDYGATAEELEAHFHGCGSVNRVTILCDKYSGHPKGFAYIEFSDKESVRTSMALDESLFRGRQIKVIPKRTNRPGISTTDRGFPRSRFRGRGGFSASRARFYSGYSRARGRAYRCLWAL